MIDDYAHHPTEIAANISALVRLRDLEAIPSRYGSSFRYEIAGSTMDEMDTRPDQVWVVLQPHTFSRVLHLWHDFVVSVREADAVLVMDVSAARADEENESMRRRVSTFLASRGEGGGGGGGGGAGEGNREAGGGGDMSAGGVEAIDLQKDCDLDHDLDLAAITSRTLAREMGGVYVGRDPIPYLHHMMRRDATGGTSCRRLRVVFMGAGDITEVAHAFHTTIPRLIT